MVKKKRPVVVWIHGGSFSRGSAAEYDPDYLLDEDIVLVTIQYRLGMFGFLSTDGFQHTGWAQSPCFGLGLGACRVQLVLTLFQRKVVCMVCNVIELLVFISVV